MLLAAVSAAAASTIITILRIHVMQLIRVENLLTCCIRMYALNIMNIVNFMCRVCCAVVFLCMVIELQYLIGFSTLVAGSAGNPRVPLRL